MENWIKIKAELFEICTQLVAEKINAIKNSINEAQEAANNETKSSAGDKHETGRAMAQLETEKLTTQLTEALKLEQTLAQINAKPNNEQAALGNLVATNNGVFYLSVSLGKIELDNQAYYAISSVSPIGKKLIGSKLNNEFSFNDKSYVINLII